MDNQQDAPQILTRHAKDRRPSYNTKAARAIAALEQRVAAVEGRAQTSPQHSSSPKCNAALEIDADLKEFGNVFNALEERITEMEKTGDDFDERLKPYDDYKSQALEAVARLTELQGRVKTASPSRADSGLSKLVDEHEASLREFSGRLLTLEDRHELAKAQPLSTRDLALALVQRMGRGDILDPIVVSQLRQALGTSGIAVEEQRHPTVRQQETPSTDDLGVTQSAIPSFVEENGSPRKRRRVTHAQSLVDEAKKIGNGSEPISTPEVESALSSFKSGGLTDEGHDDENVDTAELEPFNIPPELRRTSRQPKPTKQHPDMVHWRDANKRVKAIRPTAASPRKSAA